MEVGKLIPHMDFVQFSSFLNESESEIVKSKLDSILYPPNLKDLFSLYLLIREKKVVAIREYGSGWSTLVLARALWENKTSAVARQVDFRHPNPYRLQVIDASKEFLSISTQRASNQVQIDIDAIHSGVEMISFQSRICHVFTNVPSFTADFIYLDGPDCDQVNGAVYGRSVNFGDETKAYGLPMSADILIEEFLLWPGTMIVVDGRGANANFLKHNLARKWSYKYLAESDQHVFELLEEPWGRHSTALIKHKIQSH
jgi:hypothetical protein